MRLFRPMLGSVLTIPVHSRLLQDLPIATLLRPSELDVCEEYGQSLFEFVLEATLCPFFFLRLVLELIIADLASSLGLLLHVGITTWSLNSPSPILVTLQLSVYLSFG